MQPEEEYSGFKTRGTDIDEAYSSIIDSEADEILEDSYSDED
jgi:hypothetical protein